jgi:hypothetical protein
MFQSVILIDEVEGSILETHRRGIPDFEVSHGRRNWVKAGSYIDTGHVASQFVPE